MAFPKKSERSPIIRIFSIVKTALKDDWCSFKKGE